MKEHLYTIPVNDAFSKDCECPVCAMYKSLEEDAIEYTMGPSYMEDDIRAQSDELGFCQKHVKLMYENQNRLGLTLMLSTHMDKTMEKIESMMKSSKPQASGFFKKAEPSDIASYTKKLEGSCFVCQRIEHTFERYIATIFHMYKTDNEFKNKFRSCKGFCTKHYGLLYGEAANALRGDMFTGFINDLNEVYLSNMKRVREDLEWFRDKFDYRNADAPWKNSKDALPRSIIKAISVLPEDLP